MQAPFWQDMSKWLAKPGVFPQPSKFTSDEQQQKQQQQQLTMTRSFFVDRLVQSNSNNSSVCVCIEIESCFCDFLSTVTLVVVLRALVTGHSDDHVHV